MKKKTFYWSPCLTEVGTVKSTINSAIALAKLTNEYDVKIINVFGEWSRYKEYLRANNVEVVDLTFNFYKLLPKTGFIKSRFSYIIICIIVFFPFLNLMKNQKSSIVIAHLITSLPILIFKLFKLDSKLVLRISGMPKLNFLRKFFWKLCSKDIIATTCPSLELKEKIKKMKLFDSKKIFYLPDAVLNIKEFRKELKNTHQDKRFATEKRVKFLACGRLTRQKNFKYLINEFIKFTKIFENSSLFILGDGEEYSKLDKLIKNNNMETKIFLLGRVNNVFSYMKNADALILSSKWEEMGFVLIEAAISNLYIISSNCPNGPTEFLNDGKNGIIYESNKTNALHDSLVSFQKKDPQIKFKDKLEIKKNSIKYTMFKHKKVLIELLSNIKLTN